MAQPPPVHDCDGRNRMRPLRDNAQCDGPNRRQCSDFGLWTGLFAPSHGGLFSICRHCEWAWQANVRRQLERQSIFNSPRLRTTANPAAGPGVPAFLYQLNPIGVLSPLCHLCERDELRLYEQNVQRFPRTGRSCVCMEAMTESCFCADCTRNCMGLVQHAADYNRQQLQLTARDRAGVRCTASALLGNIRLLQNRPWACRCGRDTQLNQLEEETPVFQCMGCTMIRIFPHRIQPRRTPPRRQAAVNALVWVHTNPALDMVTLPQRDPRTIDRSFN